MKNKSLNIIKICLYIIFLTIYFFSVYVNKKFGDVSFEQILFNIIYSKGANPDVIYEGIIFVFCRVSVILIIINLIGLLIKDFKIKNRTIFSVITLIFICLFSIINSFKILNLDEYLNNQTKTSNIFEKYYVDAGEIKIKFPKEKRNLIYIYLESMESSNVSSKNGGAFSKSLIPNLEKLAKENINFSNSYKIGGAKELDNTDYTIAAIISQTSGIPLKITPKMLFDKETKLLLNTYSLGKILKDNGYNNYFLLGSDADYGARRDYFINNGDYNIYDYLWAKENKLIDEDYFVWWGYEDNKLFEFAKTKLLEISKKEEPFNFSMLTVDTHTKDGYLDETCELKFNNKYANSLYCADQKINSFINWIKQQDFYDNTTIIITGDHLTMQLDFYDESYDNRTIYNTIINSKIKPINEKNRLFSTLDMFPTTLASLGAEIKGNKLGLGVNLFSKEKTLLEELGFEYVNDELTKTSNYYDSTIIN